MEESDNPMEPTEPTDDFDPELSDMMSRLEQGMEVPLALDAKEQTQLLSQILYEMQRQGQGEPLVPIQQPNQSVGNINVNATDVNALGKILNQLFGWHIEPESPTEEPGNQPQKEE